jgi:hypothetical protein
MSSRRLATRRILVATVATSARWEVRAEVGGTAEADAFGNTHGGLVAVGQAALGLQHDSFVYEPR